MRGDENAAMPLSVYLRNSSETDFLNLYVWNKASSPRLCEGGCTLDDATKQSTRVVERLFADNNWSKVNTVFASGQGKVRMAFIKDDIGNWNLKGFDNDPEELLKAYKDAGVAAIKAVGDIASGGGLSGLSEATQAMSLANKIAVGRPDSADASEGSRTIQVLRKRTSSKLTDLKEFTASKLSNSNSTVARLEGALITDAATVADRKNALDAALKHTSDALGGVPIPTQGTTPDSLAAAHASERTRESLNKEQRDSVLKDIMAKEQQR